jgi:hypothetical protein
VGDQRDQLAPEGRVGLPKGGQHLGERADPSGVLGLGAGLLERLLEAGMVGSLASSSASSPGTAGCPLLARRPRASRLAAVTAAGFIDSTAGPAR